MKCFICNKEFKIEEVLHQRWIAGENRLVHEDCDKRDIEESRIDEMPDREDNNNG